MHFFRFFFLLLFSGSLIYALSQWNITAALAIYKEGDSLYRKALEIGEQENYDEEEEERLNRTALGKFRLFLTFTHKSNAPADKSQFDAAMKAGELLHYFDSLSGAIHYYNKAVEIKHAISNLPDTALFKPYLFSGLIYYHQNKLDSAIVFLKKAEAIQSKALQPLEEGERLYNILGSIHYEHGNYKLAKNYFQKAAEVLSASNPAYKELWVNYRINLATCLFKTEEYDSANAIYRSLLPKTTYHLNHIHNNLGLIQLALGAPGQALRFFRNVNYHDRLRIGLYNDMANAHLQLKNYDSARRHLQAALEENKIHNPANTSIDHGRTLKLLGDLERESGRFLTALEYYQKALHQFYPTYGETAIRSNPKQFSGAFSYINVFHTLVAKAEAFHALSLRSEPLAWAAQELQTYEAAFRLIGYVERSYESDEARLFLTRIKFEVHDKPIEAAYRLYQHTGDQKYIEALYRLDQQNKATTLALSRSLSHVFTTTQSTPLLERELQLRSTISRLSIKAAGITDPAELTALSQTIRDHEIRLVKVQDSVNEQAKVQGSAIPTLAHLQASVLDQKTALLNLHLSATKLTTVFLTKKDVTCFQQDLPQQFYERINRFIHALRDPSGIILPGEEKLLYQLLLGGLPLQNIEQLIIVPDDVLSYLPLESLRGTNQRYTVEYIAIQYQYSTALLNKTPSGLFGAEVLSFAPFTRSLSKDTFMTLSHSRNEIENLRGRQFFDTAATKANFLKNAGSFPILHLATHAMVNEKAEEFSFIAFSPAEKDHLLYAREIYHLPLRQTNLVILSACETGAGQLVKGEGVMSLSRAFRYAGCPNIITSLWKANDFSTAYLTTRIHQYLKEKLSIAHAVQRAKKDYLNDKSIHPRLKQPYYWSHLVFIGDVQKEKIFNWKWWLFGSILIGLPFLFLLYKRGMKR